MVYNSIGQDVIKVNPISQESIIKRSSLQQGMCFINTTTEKGYEVFKIIEQ